MNFQGNSPEYTAFALVAIESAWPNPEGGELSSDAYDLSLLNIDPAQTDTKTSVGRGKYSPTLQDYTEADVKTQRDYYRTQGYYKLIPLNVMQVKTSASKDGSSFQVTFTLDDIMMITDDDTSKALIHATGLPMNRMDLTESGLPGHLPVLREPMNDGPSHWKYVKDEELGLSRYRITGASSSFNIEDLVEANDTITIWIYHDPKDFYLKDSNAIVDNNTIQFNDSITNIIGSANRRNQFDSEKPTFVESMLGVIGLVNTYVSETIKNAIANKETNPDTPVVNKDNLYKILTSFVQEGATTSQSFDEKGALSDYTKLSFPGVLQGNKIYNGLILPYYSDLNKFTRSARLARRTAINHLISLLKETNNSKQFFEPLTTNSSFIPVQKYFSTIGLVTVSEANDFILSLNLFISGLHSQVSAYVKQYQARREITTTQQDFSNGRKCLTNASHGETPYLALKGQISDIQVSVGTTDGTHLVTLSGHGYEKILNTSEVFYDDIVFPSNTRIPLADYTTVYANMSPPRAILNIVSQWAAKQIIIGPSNNYSTLSFNRFLFIQSAAGEPADKVIKVTTSPDGPFKKDIILRGEFVYDTLTSSNFDISKLRIFTPLNYIDTSRVQEMIRTLDLSYAFHIQTIVNTAFELDTRRPIMENLKKIGGVANFYETFVDETGRLRYRLSFEAWERIVHPEYTPIIQDTDVLGGGAVFTTTDSQVRTVIDVKPIIGQSDINFTDLGWAGRSTPPAGKTPLNVDKNIPISSLSPEFFRYGMKTLKIDDNYTGEQGEARRKASLYREFYQRPLRGAKLKLRNNTSYRVGETALVALQTNKHRSRSLIDIPKVLDWLNYLKGHKDLIPWYIGVDPRLTHPDYYVQTQSYNPIPDTILQQQYVEDPHGFVLDQFIKTFKFLKDILPGINVITPEFFPPTYWFFTYLTHKFYSWNELTLKDSVIKDLYKYLLQGVILNKASAQKAAQIIFQEQEGIINAVKFHDFRAMSYYIEDVTHSFQQDSEATTSLQLNYGQDNLILLEPKRFLPIGFLSLTKSMKIGYEDETQDVFWLSDKSSTKKERTRSAIQNMYINQANEDLEFKKASFLYNSQIFRNTSNYMYELAIREGLNITTSAGAKSTSSTATPTTTSVKGANDSRALAMKVAKQLGVTDEKLIALAASKYHVTDTLTNEDVAAQIKSFYLSQ